MAFNKGNTMTDVSVDDVVVNGIMESVNSIKNAPNMTMTQLGNVIRKNVASSYKNILPGSPSALRVVINRVTNRLRSRGISIKFIRSSDSNRTRYVTFKFNK